MGDSITDTIRVIRYLPADYDTERITSMVISDAMEAAHDYYATRVYPTAPAGSMDIHIETLLAAVEVRNQIENLSNAEESNTKAFENRAEKMIKARIDVPTLAATQYNTPVGPGGRDAEGEDAPPSIFKVVPPEHDEYENVYADDPHRPGNLSE